MISLQEYLLSFYDSLLQQGWSMQDIDEMDILYFFEILAYRKEKEAKANTAYIDQIF